MYEDEGFSQNLTIRYVDYIVEFSTQHRHFDADNEDDIREYILAILNDEVLPLEFYMDGKRRFGGEIGADDWDKLSVSFLNHGRYTNEYMMSLDYEIHSWSGKYDTGLRKVSELKP